MSKFSSVDFDMAALFAAVQTKQESRGLSDKQMMADLNAVNQNRVPFSFSTVKNMQRRGDGTCQHVLHILRWLDKTPESFLVGMSTEESLSMPSEGRIYWDMRALGTAVVEQKTLRELTWQDVAQDLRCSKAQASGLRKLRYGISIHLAMRITQWLGLSARAFIVRF